MTTLPIPDTLASAYKGSGYALASIRDGAIRDFLYLNDLLPNFDPNLLDKAITDFRLHPSVTHLSLLGDVSVGMVSCWEFTEI